MKQSATTAHVATPVLGFSTGLRSFTPLAVAAWFAREGRLPVEGTWASWIAHPAVVGLLTLGAAGEYIGDKLPNAPDRTSPLALTGRLILGGLVGAIVATASRRPVGGGIALGAAGALAGAYGGLYARQGLTHTAGLSDFPVALGEDALAVTLAILSMRQLEASAVA